MRNTKNAAWIQYLKKIFQKKTFKDINEIKNYTANILHWPSLIWPEEIKNCSKEFIQKKNNISDWQQIIWMKEQNPNLSEQENSWLVNFPYGHYSQTFFQESNQAIPKFKIKTDDNKIINIRILDVDNYDNILEKVMENKVFDENKQNKIPSKYKYINFMHLDLNSVSKDYRILDELKSIYINLKKNLKFRTFLSLDVNFMFLTIVWISWIIGSYLNEDNNDVEIKNITQIMQKSVSQILLSVFFDFFYFPDFLLFLKDNIIDIWTYFLYNLKENNNAFLKLMKSVVIFISGLFLTISAFLKIWLFIRYRLINGLKNLFLREICNICIFSSIVSLFI